eukprot:450502-Lingulodinium_polyedra.AAC.1
MLHVVCSRCTGACVCTLGVWRAAFAEGIPRLCWLFRAPVLPVTSAIRARKKEAYGVEEGKGKR